MKVQSNVVKAGPESEPDRALGHGPMAKLRTVEPKY